MGISSSNSPGPGSIESNDHLLQPYQSQPHHPDSKQASRETEHTPTVHGIDLTPLTQCTHYHSPLDIIAIQHYCCRKFYACIKCHDECENPSSISSSHGPSRIWPKEMRGEKAVLCGKCKRRLGIDEYMGSGSRCTGCGEGFNPGCKAHWGLYFEV